MSDHHDPGLTAEDLANQLHSGSARMADIFALAKRFAAADLEQVELLLDSPIYEHRVGAVSIMDFQARRRSTSATHRRALYELYLRRHDRINDWSLVDRAAPSVVGGYLDDDTFALAELLVDDPEHLVQTAVGGSVREAGKRDRGRLRAFLDAHAAIMPRTTLRCAIEHLDADERRHYRSMTNN